MLTHNNKPTSPLRDNQPSPALGGTPLSFHDFLSVLIVICLIAAVLSILLPFRAKDQKEIESYNPPGRPYGAERWRHPDAVYLDKYGRYDLYDTEGAQ
jgi:hypothetical protein